jgi:hypothetical protein
MTFIALFSSLFCFFTLLRKKKTKHSASAVKQYPLILLFSRFFLLNFYLFLRYTPAQKTENIPLLLSCTPVANDLAHFKLFLTNAPEYAEEFPVLSILLSLAAEINVLR